MSMTQILKIMDTIAALDSRVAMLEEKVETLGQQARIQGQKKTSSGDRVPPTARPQTLANLELGSDPKGA